MSDTGSVFSQFVTEIPEKLSEPEKILRGPLLQPVVPPTDRNSSAAARLLDWLINDWDQPCIRVRDISLQTPGAALTEPSVTAMSSMCFPHTDSIE
jgi:hypothetical protein